MTLDKKALAAITDRVLAHRPVKDDIREGQSEFVPFRKREIRRVFYKNEWFYSVIDVVGAIVETERASQYWHDLYTQIIEKEGLSRELYGKIGQLNMQAEDGG